MRRDDCLMAQADAEHGQPPGRTVGQLDGASRVLRRARPRGQNEQRRAARGSERKHIAGRHVVPDYVNPGADPGAVVARDPAVHAELAWWANCVGISESPFDSFLTLRGLRTLHPRIRAHGENAARLAALLEHHPAVERVHYPGLASHPGHAIAARQQSGFGAMISFELAGDVPAVRRFVGRLRHFSLAESLGGVESLVAHPATMTHAAMDPAARARAGISDALVRISVGIEAGEDLERDLEEALG